MRMAASWWDRTGSAEYKVVAREPPTKSPSITVLEITVLVLIAPLSRIRARDPEKYPRRRSRRGALPRPLTKRTPYKGR